jgi:hypothetical protein
MPGCWRIFVFVFSRIVMALPSVALFLDFQWWAEFKYAMQNALLLQILPSPHILWLYLLQQIGFVIISDVLILIN